MRPLAILLALTMLLPAMAMAGQRAEAADYIGWQEETFERNVKLDYGPKSPTPTEPVVVSIESLDSRVFIQVAYLYLTIKLVEGRTVTTGLSFSRVNATAMTCTLSSYANGTVVTFYVNVLDYYNVPLISQNYTYSVYGSDRPGGWLHSEFQRNVLLNMSSISPNATEQVHVTIDSIENNTVYGANLYIVFEAEPGKPQSGGFPFRVVNATAMEVDIPGYPGGTKVSFWVAAWDKYNNLTVSPYYNYTVQEAQNYTAHDFVPSMDLWAFPGLAGVVVLGVISYAVMSRKEKRRRERGDDYMKGGAK
ncbi:MAG: hypothetical protein HZB92_01570 [Euryarchaeota archaeon]|nr:hypothetical protein [Euryarchaeota archaeon]